jgi:hypothetical protein
MVINGLGGVIFGQVIVLTPPSFSTPSNNCTGSFTVTWGAVTFATSYMLQRRLNGGAWTTIYSGPNLSFAQSNLAPGSYEYQIIAVKGSKQSDPVATGTVSVLAQGNVGAPSRVGNQLIQQVRSGCSLSNTVVGTYGCTDPTASNYNASATINEGCTYPPAPIDCPLIYQYGISQGNNTDVARTIHIADTVTFQRPSFTCGAGTSGTILGLSFTDQYGNPLNGDYTIDGASGTYSGNDWTINFTTHAHAPYFYWSGYIRITFTGLQPN